jgi:Ca-activated chloride channel family protein
MGNYNDALLEQLADDGDGFYAYVNSRDEAHELFSTRLTQSLEVVALDARARVDFSADTVAAYRLLGYENRAIPDRDFTNDGVDAGAIGSGHAVTALYAIRLQPGTSDHDGIATVRLRWTDPDRRSPDETREEVAAGDLARSFEATDATFRRDAIVAATAEAIRGTSDELGIREVAAIAQRDAPLLPPTDEVHDFLVMLQQLAARE